MIKKELIATILILIVIFLLIFYFLSIKMDSSYEKEDIEGCSSSLSFSLSGFGTCELTASISTNFCKGKKYEIKNDIVECSGYVGNEKEVIFCNWQVPFGEYTYDLYIDNKLKYTRNIKCFETEPSDAMCPIS